MDRENHLHLLLAVTDDKAREELAEALRARGFDVDEAGDEAAATSHAARCRPDVLVATERSPGIDGILLLRRMRAEDPALPVILITTGEPAASTRAMRAGADERIEEPVDVAALLVAIQRAVELRDLREESDALRDRVHEIEDTGFDGLVGTSPPMMEVYASARRIVRARANILIQGERGTGRTRLARAIHEASGRRMGPFVVVPCAQLGGDESSPAQLVARAAKGTLFLGEVDHLSITNQKALLGVLDEQRTNHGTARENGDARVIASTQADLRALVAEHRFREELLFRLDVVHIKMPPLRERGGDVQLLAEHFLRKLAGDRRRAIEGFSEAVRSALALYPWPGNVGELEQAVERAVTKCDGSTIDRAHLPDQIASLKVGAVTIPGSSMAAIERYAILTTLEATHWSTSRAAKILDMSVRTIQYRLAQYGLKVSRGAPAPAE